MFVIVCLRVCGLYICGCVFAICVCGCGCVFMAVFVISSVAFLFVVVCCGCALLVVYCVFRVCGYVLCVEVRKCPLRSGGADVEKDGRRRRALIKSNKPHLARGGNM